MKYKLTAKGKLLGELATTMADNEEQLVTKLLIGITAVRETVQTRGLPRGGAGFHVDIEFIFEQKDLA